jgi:Rhodopirellula transposase DDE domain
VSFKSQRLYTRLSAAEVRKQLIEKYGYSDEKLHTSETIRVKLNNLGYKLRRFNKAQPQKKFHFPDAIFEQLDIVNKDADEDKSVWEHHKFFNLHICQHSHVIRN